VLPGRSGGWALDGTDDSKVCTAIRETRASAWRSEPICAGSSIGRAHHGERAGGHAVRGDHRRSQVLVAEQALERAKVRASLQEVRGEAALQQVAGGRWRKEAALGRSHDATLHGEAVQESCGFGGSHLSSEGGRGSARCLQGGRSGILRGL
jgi:hypothetical protein